MKRDVLPMPSFGGTGITGPTLSLAEQVEAATVAARETAQDRERLALENARLQGLLKAVTSDAPDSEVTPEAVVFRRLVMDAVLRNVLLECPICGNQDQPRPVPVSGE